MSIIEKISVTVIASIFIAIITASAVGIIGWHYKTGDGTHTGYVTAAHRAGVLFPSNTIYFKTNLQSSQEDRYCVLDSAVYDTLVTAQARGENVTVNYIRVIATGGTSCNDEEDIIVGVK